MDCTKLQVSVFFCSVAHLSYFLSLTRSFEEFSVSKYFIQSKNFEFLKRVDIMRVCSWWSGGVLVYIAKDSEVIRGTNMSPGIDVLFSCFFSFSSNRFLEIFS